MGLGWNPLSLAVDLANDLTHFIHSLDRRKKQNEMIEILLKLRLGWIIELPFSVNQNTKS